MSTPITACQVFKAAKGDEEAYKYLLEAMKYNFTCGHWSQLGCYCKPSCEPASEEQMKAFETRINHDLAEWEKTRGELKKPSYDGGPRSDTCKKPSHDMGGNVNMRLFKTPEEAIAACEAGFEKAWTEFTTANGIKLDTNQQYYDLTKKIFHSGYANGAKFISETIISSIEQLKKDVNS